MQKFRNLTILVLAAAGTRPHALAALRAGARDPEGAHRCLDQTAVR